MGMGIPGNRLLYGYAYYFIAPPSLAYHFMVWYGMGWADPLK